MLDYYAVVNFLPLIHQERKWSDRKQTVAVPLFPSYLFVQTPRSSDVLLRVLMVPGIVDFVRGRTGPVPIPDTEIESVRTVLSRNIGCSPHSFLKAGDRVRVVRGALAGIEGLLLRSGGQSKLILSVDMIQRSVAVNVDASDVEPISRMPARDAPSFSAAQTA